ncbi:MAG: hypothetical protein CMH63_02290 [Nanoarchaeota archaeon]|nr:hypothetical protein [Nanoarchaeota archaeon]|tara:strand:+ start:13584 stop:14039 length:456 start_codon:yes stop_codon:yes gene_type:complete
MEKDYSKGLDPITEFGNKVLRKGGLQALEDLCKDISGNISITQNRIEQIVQSYDLMDFVGECAILLQLNKRLEILNKNNKPASKPAGKGVSNVEKERRLDYLKTLPSGDYDTRELARGLDVTTSSLGNFLKYHGKKVGLKNTGQQYRWEKS